jgi:hypothetical protein
MICNLVSTRGYRVAARGVRLNFAGGLKSAQRFVAKHQTSYTRSDDPIVLRTSCTGANLNTWRAFLFGHGPQGRGSPPNFEFA